MEKRVIDWQAAIAAVASVVVILFGTGTQIHPLEGNQQEIVGKLLELSTANRELNRTILESVSESHTLNVEMLKKVDERDVLFKELMDKLNAIEKKLK